MSHIMVSLAVFLLLVFGAGGMGCQRCSCSGRVSILLIDDGCCGRGSDCMDVKVSPVSAAENDCANVLVCRCGGEPWQVIEIGEQLLVSYWRTIAVASGWQCRGINSPPGWLADNCAVLRV